MWLQRKAARGWEWPGRTAQLRRQPRTPLRRHSFRAPERLRRAPQSSPRAPRRHPKTGTGLRTGRSLPTPARPSPVAARRSLPAPRTPPCPHSAAGSALPADPYGTLNPA